ncbi:MAG TPA: DNA alkylation repair protein [Ruminococcus flavefaciens]|nr:DNA alkylation repair protein [Ruminococcus flavefaciens]
MDKITEKLFAMQDTKYRDFQVKLIPGSDPDTFIGTRTPQLRSLAKEMLRSGDADGFLEELPHRYFDENQLHGFIISEVKDFDEAMALTEKFLPYVDNWATCDQLRPKAFKKNNAVLAAKAKEWIASGKTYTVRFGIGMLMSHFLDADFDPEYMETVAAVKSDEYYVNMMTAWYFATALAKQYSHAVKYIEDGVLSEWVHNKTIQKAAESFRVSGEHKEYLKTLKR